MSQTSSTRSQRQVLLRLSRQVRVTTGRANPYVRPIAEASRDLSLKAQAVVQLRTLEVRPVHLLWGSLALAAFSIFTGFTYPKPVRLAIVVPIFTAVGWVSWKNYKGEL